MHKLLVLQLKKCFGEAWESEAISPQTRHLLDLVDQAYKQFDDDLQILERTLDVNSRELTSALQTAKQQHDLLRNVTDSFKDIIFYKDLEFRLIGGNHALETIVGQSIAELIGKTDFDIFPHDQAAGFRSLDEKVLAQMAPESVTEWVTSKEGKQILMVTTKYPLLNARGTCFGLVGISRDITRERQMEEEIKSQQAMLIQQSRLAAMGEMIGNIAHQWRQPLNTLGLAVQDIKDAYSFGELNEEYLDHYEQTAMEQINYMSQTIDDFRNFFSPNKQQKYFVLKECVDETLHILQHGLKKEEIDCTAQIPEDLRILGFKNEFTQVLFNLIKNAKDALVDKASPSPHITIKAGRTGSSIEIRVEDNAGGIPEAIREKIFDPYFTTKEEGKGTGIGLYMSKTIIEQHMNGSLIYRPIPQGSAFIVCIPVLSEDGEEHPREL